MSSSATIISAAPPPTTPIPVLAIFLPKLVIPKALFAFFAAIALFASRLATLLPYFAPITYPPTPSGAT